MKSPFHDDEDELPISVLANRRKISLRTVHRWRTLGKLQSTKIGGRFYVSRESWDRFVEACNGAPPDPSRPVQRTAAQRRRDDEIANRRAIELGA